jgi:hypothetical protein
MSAASAAAQPIAAGAVAGALDSVADESKDGAGVSPRPKTMVSSFEEYLEGRGYEPWRSKFTYSWWPTTNNNYYSGCAPSFLYKGNKKPASAKVNAAVRGTIQEKLVKMQIDGEEKEVKQKTIMGENGQPVAKGQYAWANPNRVVDEATGQAGDYAPPSKPSDPQLQRANADLASVLFEVISDENNASQIQAVDFCIRGGLFAPLKWQFKLQEHTWNWGLGSTFEDFCKIYTCFFTLWGIVGAFYYLLLLAAIETSEDLTALYLFFGMMFTGWIFIGISLGAQKISDAQAKRKAAEEA